MDGACWVCFCCWHLPAYDYERQDLLGTCNETRAYINWASVYTFIRKVVGGGIRTFPVPTSKFPRVDGSEEVGNSNAASHRITGPTYQLSCSDPTPRANEPMSMDYKTPVGTLCGSKHLGCDPCRNSAVLVPQSSMRVRHCHGRLRLCTSLCEELPALNRCCISSFVACLCHQATAATPAQLLSD